MEFRPCIDIHNGKVKQIVGGSLKDRGDFASENFVSEQDSRFYADMYRKSGIKGGHIILLNSVDSEYYEDTKEQAVMALEAYPQGLQAPCPQHPLHVPETRSNMRIAYPKALWSLPHP